MTYSTKMHITKEQRDAFASLIEPAEVIQRRLELVGLEYNPFYNEIGIHDMIDVWRSIIKSFDSSTATPDENGFVEVEAEIWDEEAERPIGD